MRWHANESKSMLVHANDTDIDIDIDIDTDTDIDTDIVIKDKGTGKRETKRKGKWIRVHGFCTPGGDDLKGDLMAKKCYLCGAPLEVHRENGVPDYYKVIAFEWHFIGGYKPKKMRLCRTCYEGGRREETRNSRT